LEPETPNTNPIQPRQPTPPLIASDRRRISKDTLLSDEPPRALTVAIVLIAALLGILIAVCWSFEYEQTVPINLYVENSPPSGYALGYLPASSGVEVGQKVHLQPGSISSAGREATVAAVSEPTKGGLYIVRVDLPDSLRNLSATSTTTEANPGPEITAGNSPDAEPENNPPLAAPASATKISGSVVIRRARLFARLFNVFRTIAGADKGAER